MADNTVESINKVAQPGASSSNDAPAAVSGVLKTAAETKAPEPDPNAPPAGVDTDDTDAGKTAGAAPPLVPANPVTQTEAASVPVAGPTNKEPPSIAKGDLSSKTDAADTLAQQPEKQTDQIPTPVSQPQLPAAGGTAAATTTTAAAEASVAPDAEPKLSPKPVSVEEVRDEAAPTAKPAPAGAQADKAGEVVLPDVTSAPPDPKKPESETGDKRKADDIVDSSSAEANKPTLNGTAGDEEPAEKKQKSNGASTSTNGTASRKPGRPKKEKKGPAPVGKTARKTRSQGAAEAQ